MLAGNSKAVFFKDFCWEEWKSKYGTSPPWGFLQFVHLTDARNKIDTEELAREAWMLYLANTERFFEGHPPGKFLLELGKFVSKAALRPPPGRKPKSFPGAARAAAMAAIVREVTFDDSIPAPQKQNEMKKRWQEIPLDT